MVYSPVKRVNKKTKRAVQIGLGELSVQSKRKTSGGVQLHLTIWWFGTEWLINSDGSSIHSVTWILQYPSHYNVEKEQSMRRQQETAEKPRCDSCMYARPGLSQMTSSADVEQ